VSLGGHWLVVRGGALGDWILTLPALTAIRRHADRVTLITKPRHAALRPDLFDELHDITSLSTMWLYGTGAAPTASFDHAFCVTPGVAPHVAALGVPDVRSVEPRPADGVHASTHLSSGLDDLGPMPNPSLTPTPEALAHVDAALPHPCPVVLAPGAASASKQWGGMPEVAAMLVERGLPVVWAPGKDEPPFDVPAGHILPTWDLPELVALAHRCRVWIGNDTGTSHLAAAAGARTLAMFGPTDPACWSPTGAMALPFGSAPSWLVDWVLGQQDDGRGTG